LETRVPQAWQVKRRRDSQYAAAARIFDFIARCWAYADDDGVRKQDLLDTAGAWSQGEYILVRIALDLYDPGCVIEHGHSSANVGEIAGALDDRFYNVYQDAMRLARAG